MKISVFLSRRALAPVILTAGLLFGLVTGAVSSAQADVLYTVAPNYGQPAYHSVGPFGQQLNNKFTLTATATVTQATWYGIYLSGMPADKFSLNFYTGDTGPNSTATASTLVFGLTRTDTGMVDSYSAEVYAYNATLVTPFPVTGGTPYYLSIIDTSSSWAWQNGAANTNGYDRSGTEGTDWSADSIVHSAFTLSSANAPTPLRASRIPAALSCCWDWV